MKPLFKQRSPLLRPLVITTFSIIILLSLSCFFVVRSSNRLKLNAAVLKITTTQRSLSQEIVNYIAADNLGGQTPELSLDSMINSFAQMQSALLHGNKDMDVMPLKQSMVMEYHKLDVGYIRFFRELDHNISDNSNAAFIKLLNVENLYLQQLDSFTHTLSGYSNEEVKSFQFKEIFILCISMLLIFLEVRFIFIPATKKIEGQNKVLREISFTQAHIIRRPLTNIQSLLTLILESKKQDQFSTELLTLAKKEADELDEVIKNNVHKSDKHNKVAI